MLENDEERGVFLAILGKLTRNIQKLLQISPSGLKYVKETSKRGEKNTNNKIPGKE